MSKSRQKGYRTVAKIRKLFEDEGYIVANLEKTGKFIKEKDLFNLWDILCVRGKTHVFIQAKTNAKGHKWKQPYIEFGRKHGSRTVKYEIWNKLDRKYFLVTECKADIESDRIEKFI